MAVQLGCPFTMFFGAQELAVWCPPDIEQRPITELTPLVEIKKLSSGMLSMETEVLLP